MIACINVANLQLARVLDRTPPAPGLAYATAISRPAEEVARLREGLFAALARERGLEVRGHFREPAGEMVDSVLGGKYRILRKIGSGGIGVVYAAEHVAPQERRGGVSRGGTRTAAPSPGPRTTSWIRAGQRSASGPSRR